MDPYVAKPDFRILLVLARLCNYHDKLYCYPNPRTIRDLVFRFTGRVLSNRTLSRHVGALDRDGWIRRQSRHDTGPTGELELHSNLYILTRRTVKWCRSLGTKLWNFSIPAAKSLIDIALPFVAETLAQAHHSTSHRAAHGPPKRAAPR